MRKRLSNLTIGSLVLLLMLATLIVPSDASAYDGILKVFVVEPESRWSDRYGDPYGYGFLDFAMETDLSLSDSVWQGSATWDAAAAGFNGFTQHNCMVIAVLFGTQGEQRDAAPPLEIYFTAYPTHAAAAATPGSPGSNLVNEEYTHTVFIEEGTSTT